MVENQKDLEEILSTLEEEAEEIAFDIETNGVAEHVVETVGIAFTWFDDGGCYLPLYEWDVEEKCLQPLFSDSTREKMVKRLLDCLKDKKLIMHNGVFDISCIFHRYGINLTSSIYADTMLMKHTVDEERPFNLKDIGEMLFGEEAKDEQEKLAEEVKARGGKWLKTKKDMYMASKETLGEYAIKDVILTLKIFDEYEYELELQDLDNFFYKKEVMPLYKAATIPMKLNGLYIDEEYFKTLKKNIQDDIMKLTDEVFDLIKDDIEPKVKEILDKAVRTSRTGKFAEGVLRYYELPVPLNKKTGKPTLAKSALRSLEADYPEHIAIEWLLWDSKSDDEEPELPEDVVYDIKKEIYVDRKPEYPYVFNLSSTHHLSWLIYEVYGEEPHKRSKKTGKPTVDKNSLEEFDLPFIEKLAKLKKEEKILSTYINPILERQHKGWLYPSMQQWGTTSGRYSCGGGLNFQTLPRDDIRIKQGFIAPPGYKVVSADFSSLEPRIFSWVSDDPGLKQVYWDDLDLYSKIAIDVFGLSEYSAKEGDSNFLKDVNKDLRDLAKVFTLAVPYGAGPGRIAGLMKKEFMDAKEIIQDYLDTYPGLKDYMQNQEEDAYKNGMVYTRFGRVRHLPKAKELYKKYGKRLFNKKRLTSQILKEGYSMKEGQDIANEIYYEFRNYMNNAKNFPIQATAAHVTNSALIYLSELLEDNNIDGWICLQIHDEIVCIVKEEQADLAADLLQESMENNWVAREIDIPMIAQPEIGNNFAEVK